MGLSVKSGFAQGTNYLLTMVHEKNAMSLTTSEILGTSSKLIDTEIIDRFVTTLSYEARQERLVRYPKMSRGKCDQGNKSRLDLSLFPAVK